LILEAVDEVAKCPKGSRFDDWAEDYTAQRHNQKTIQRVELKAAKCCIQGQQDIGTDLKCADGSLIVDVCLIEAKPSKTAFNDEHERQAKAQALCMVPLRQSGGLVPVDDDDGCIVDTRPRGQVKLPGFYTSMCHANEGMSQSTYADEGVKV
jgi:hypothetical protein